MELTISLTAEEKEALNLAFPGLSLEEAGHFLIRNEMQRRYRNEVKRGTVVRLQALKRNRDAEV